MIADVPEYLWRDTVLIPSDGSAPHHVDTNVSLHHLATQTNVLVNRFNPIGLTSSGGSLGTLEVGPIWGVVTLTASTSGSSVSAYPVITHSSGLAITARRYGLTPWWREFVGTTSGDEQNHRWSCVVTWEYQIPERGEWTVSGLAGNAVFFV